MQYIALLCDTRDCLSQLLNTFLEVYRVKLYEYNRKVSKFGVYLKPLHIVTKQCANTTKTYYYYGRYWYKLIRKEGKLKWIYLGTTKPYAHLPDPPLNPLTLIEIKNRENNSCIYVIDSEISFKSLIEILSVLKPATRLDSLHNL